MFDPRAHALTETICGEAVERSVGGSEGVGSRVAQEVQCANREIGREVRNSGREWSVTATA